MAEAVLDIDLLRDWQVLREVRLNALRESPHAFTSRYQIEAAWGESDWRALLDARTWVVATDQQHGVIGIAGLVVVTRHVESVWVAPDRRRRGVLKSLVDRIAEIGRGIGLPALHLWVLEGNEVAWTAYQQLGFEPTGEREPIRKLNRTRYERRLRLAI